MFDEGVQRLTQIPGYDPQYAIVYYNYWYSYEEYGWLAILELAGNYFRIEGGYSVMIPSPQEDTWDLYPLTEDDAIELMIEYDVSCEEIKESVIV